ncbi:MAG TPA: carboxymuconolactone decarboxylase family protein [Thermoleophilaceae bacterium]|jgi:AhpD family alkylhydroperoxidase
MTTSTTVKPQARMELSDHQQGLWKAMLRFDAEVGRTGLEPELLELVRTRASQINHCAYCIDMHTKDALARGETEQRLFALNAWRETPFFTERERAALALVEEITLVSERQVPDDVFEEAARHFDPGELAGLIYAATVINAWNRLAISTRMVAGEYEPGGD